MVEGARWNGFSLWLAICCSGSGWVFAQTEVEVRTLAEDESLSRSGQILVRSADAKQRGEMASFAETVSGELGQILGDGSVAWEYPIEIETQGSLGDAGVTGRTVATRIDLMEGGKFVLRLYVKLSDEFSRQQFSREILRLLLLERMLRKQQGADKLAGKRLETPDWILSGMNALMDYRRQGRPSDLYSGIVKSRQLLSVDEILTVDPGKLDSLSRASYEASAAALLSALFDQPDGVASFRGLLSKLILFEGDAQLLLKEEFPGLRGDEKSVDKWWALQVATMGELQAMEYLDAAETDRRLEQALMVSFPVSKKEDNEKKGGGFFGKLLPFGKNKEPEFTNGRIHDFEQFYKRKDSEEVLERNQLKLRALKFHSFPLYTPVIARYEEVVARLMKGKRRDVEEDLREIDAERARIGVAMERVVDYLNYYEATQLEQPGQEFEKYHQTMGNMRQQKPPPRPDRISKYLDTMEAEFSGGGTR